MATPFVKVVFEGTSTARLIRLCDTRDFEAVRCVAHSKSLYVAGSDRSVSSATQLHDAFVQHKGSAPLVLQCAPGRPSGSQPVSLPDYPAGKFYGHDATPSIIAHVFASPNPIEAEQRNQEHPSEGLNTVDPLHVLANGKAATLPDVLRLFEVLHPTSTSAVSYIIRSLPRDTAAAFITVILPAIAKLACAPVPQVPGASKLVLSSTVIAQRLARGFLGVNGATSGLHLLLTKTRACQNRWPRVDELRQRVHLLIGYFRTQQAARPRNVSLRRLQRSSDVSVSALESCSTIRPPELDARVAFGDDVAQVWPVSSKLASDVFRSDSSERCNRVLEFPEILVTLDEDITGRDLDPQHEILVFSDLGRFFSFHSVQRQFVPVQPVTVLEKVACAVFDDYQSLSISQVYEEAHMVQVVSRWVFILREIGEERVACEPMPVVAPDLHFLLVAIAASITKRTLIFHWAKQSGALADAHTVLPILARITIKELWEFVKRVRRADGPVFHQLSLRFLTGNIQPARHVFNKSFPK